MGRPGDVLIGLSTSGESRNVLRALQTARALGIGTIAFTGSRPSSMDAVGDVLLKAPASETWRVQECHLPLYHALCAGVEQELS
jgi:phosphoheptose isomerase